MYRSVSKHFWDQKCLEAARPETVAKHFIVIPATCVPKCSEVFRTQCIEVYRSVSKCPRGRLRSARPTPPMRHALGQPMSVTCMRGFVLEARPPSSRRSSAAAFLPSPMATPLRSRARCSSTSTASPRSSGAIARAAAPSVLLAPARVTAPRHGRLRRSLELETLSGR